MLNITVSSH